jgi:predicted DsbA family dithiol-disulfide isomerase
MAISLQPALFSKYGINRVPAVVYENGKDTYSIQGDAGLDYLLERINREAKSTALAGLIKKMRGAY